MISSRGGCRAALRARNGAARKARRSLLRRRAFGDALRSMLSPVAAQSIQAFSIGYKIPLYSCAMTLHQLRYVCEIARCKLNISKAAQAVKTSQPALSQQVRLLE
jgi:hypothetical protein